MDNHAEDKNGKIGQDQEAETLITKEAPSMVEEKESEEETETDRNGQKTEEANDKKAEADHIEEEKVKAEKVEWAEAEAKTEEGTLEDEDVTEPAVKLIEVDEEEMLFTRRKVKNLEEETKKLNNELNALKDRMLRLTAEYENYRNRTAREKEEIEGDCIAKVLGDILPVMDNLERALISETDDLPGLKDGVQMTLDQFILALEKMGVELIPTDSGFDPEFHEAVMHEMDETRGEKEITGVFLKGYKKGNKIVRHSVVKVVN